jgi:hypothetical protein
LPVTAKATELNKTRSAVNRGINLVRAVFISSILPVFFKGRSDRNHLNGAQNQNSAVFYKTSFERGLEAGTTGEARESAFVCSKCHRQSLHKAYSNNAGQALVS